MPIPTIQYLILLSSLPPTNPGQQEPKRAQKGQPRQTKEGIAEECGPASGQKRGPKVANRYFTLQSINSGRVRLGHC